MPLKIEQFHHAGFLVTDVPRAAKFYEGILGLKALARPDFGFDGRWYDLGNGLQLHLMETKSMPGMTDQPRFDRHIALSVVSLDDVAKEFDSHGVEYSMGSGRAGSPQLFVRDPDGNMIEFRPVA